MSRRPATFTQADVARALRAIAQCNYPGVVEIERDGVIRIVPAARPEPHAAPAEIPSPLDGDGPIEL